MIFKETPLRGAYIVEIDVFQDDRGYFGRTFCKNEFKGINHDKEFVQFNLSFTKHKGTIRGMHYQLPPNSEIKLVRCVRGSVWDVLVDLRKDSPTFLKHYGIELNDKNLKMVYIPEGFAHGFQALEDNSELIYHHSASYTPESERGLNYKDVLIGIEWPVLVSNISEKDRTYPYLTESFKGIEI